MPGYIIFKCNTCGHVFDMDANDPIVHNAQNVEVQTLEF